MCFQASGIKGTSTSTAIDHVTALDNEPKAPCPMGSTFKSMDECRLPMDPIGELAAHARVLIPMIPVLARSPHSAREDYNMCSPDQ